MKSRFIDLINKTNKESIVKILSTEKRIYTFLNPVSYLDAKNHKELFADFDGIFADGSLLVAAIWLLYGKKVKRKSFDMTSIAPLLFKFACENSKSVYLIGSRPDEIEKAKQNLLSNYPKLNVIGYRNGYFSSAKESEIEIEKILNLNPNFVIVGMGIIKQETFLLNLKSKGYSGIGFTCGGFLHQTSKNIIMYYPRWVDQLNIRFLYRIIKEKHTRIRYFKAAFIFPFAFILDRF